MEQPNATSPQLPQGAVCPKCKTLNPTFSKFCGACGSPMKRKGSPLLLGCLGFIGLITVLAMLGNLVNNRVAPSSSSRHPTSASAPDETNHPTRSNNPRVCLVLLESHGTVNEYSTTIAGSIKNDCGRKFRYVQVTFKLFNVNGDVVGTALANQNDLDPGETWEFKAHGFTKSHVFRLSEITGF